MISVRRIQIFLTVTRAFISLVSMKEMLELPDALLVNQEPTVVKRVPVYVASALPELPRTFSLLVNNKALLLEVLHATHAVITHLLMSLDKSIATLVEATLTGFRLSFYFDKISVDGGTRCGFDCSNVTFIHDYNVTRTYNLSSVR